jgi:hypothetical protein
MTSRMIDYQADPGLWAQSHFSRARLGHCTRSRRLVKVASAMAHQPGDTIPELFDSKYDIQAAYHLFDLREATADAIQSGHRNLVRGQLRTPGRYLLIEDTSFLSFTHRSQAVQGLGPIAGSEPGQQGFMLHSVLAVRADRSAVADATGRRPPVEIIGLADQQYLIRQRRPEGEPRHNAARRPRDRESRRWLDSGQRLGRAPEDQAIRWVRVADREADIYEYLRSCIEAGHGFLVRAAQDRVVLDEDQERVGLMREHILTIDVFSHLPLDLRARPGQAARRADLSISFGPVSLRAPGRVGRAAGTDEPLNCWFVRAWEANPPEGVEPLEWVLYCDNPITEIGEAIEAVMNYATRYLIEDFHKGLKSGLGAERLQLETANRLFAAVAVMSVVALRLIDLREALRCDPEGPASASGLNTEERRVLGLRLRRDLVTVKDVALALGRLGGHMNRKADGLPGWITLWRGMKKLRLLIEGMRLGRASEKGTTRLDGP